MSDRLQNTIGSLWEDVQVLEWSGYFPLFEVIQAEIIVVGLIEADREDLSDLVPIAYRNGEACACLAGDQDGFMLASEYRKFFDQQTGGSR
jgi:hypothetical protein